jgi:hypothetical protein
MNTYEELFYSPDGEIVEVGSEVQQELPDSKAD